MAIKIIGTGSYLPENVADNHFLSTIVDTNDEWISQRTGIVKRKQRGDNIHGNAGSEECDGRCRRDGRGN